MQFSDIPPLFSNCSQLKLPTAFFSYNPHGIITLAQQSESNLGCFLVLGQTIDDSYGVCVVMTLAGSDYYGGNCLWTMHLKKIQPIFRKYFAAAIELGRSSSAAQAWSKAEAKKHLLWETSGALITIQRKGHGPKSRSWSRYSVQLIYHMSTGAAAVCCFCCSTRRLGTAPSRLEINCEVGLGCGFCRQILYVWNDQKI